MNSWRPASQRGTILIQDLSKMHLFPADAIEATLPPSIATSYRRARSGQDQSIPELRAALAAAVARLTERAAEDEFYDLQTGQYVARGCNLLLDRLQREPSPQGHAAAQAAVLYFILEDDAEPDASIVGFDDDLLVLDVTARVLGWTLEEPPR